MQKQAQRMPGSGVSFRTAMSACVQMASARKRERTRFGLGGDAVVHRPLQLGGLEGVLRHRALPMAQRCKAQTHAMLLRSNGLQSSNAQAATALKHLSSHESVAQHSVSSAACVAEMRSTR